MNHVKEVVVFRLNPNVDVQVFLDSAKVTFDWVKTMEGFISRDLSVTETGEWIDIVQWQTMANALHAAEQIMNMSSNQSFINSINPTTVSMDHVHPQLSGKK
jgi:hypothetical protein